MDPLFLRNPLSRREALRLISGTALALTAGRWLHAETKVAPSPFNSGITNTSLLSPELTEGPYYIDLERVRRDITEGKPGVPLRLRIKVAHITTGRPIKGAAVDVWHCDAQGVYSGFSGAPGPEKGRGLPPGPPPDDDWLAEFMGLSFPVGPGFGPHKPTNNLTFLRGVQLTGADGIAEIDTIFPGWYMGRTTHIHVRVHTGGMVAGNRYEKGHICHTGQIFFPQDITEQVYKNPAYHRTSNDFMPLADDGIFRQGGSQISTLSAFNPKKPILGYYSDTVLIIDPAASPNRV